MRRDDIRMGEAARELLDGRGDAPDPLGTLSPEEAALMPPSREWVEMEEAWAYFSLQLAAGVRARLARMAPDDRNRERELDRLGRAREAACLHLEALRRAGLLTDRILVDLANAEGLL